MIDNPGKYKLSRQVPVSASQPQKRKEAKYERSDISKRSFTVLYAHAQSGRSS